MDVTLAGNSTSAGAGYILISSGTLTLAGGANITLSQNGNAVTVSGGAGGAFTGGASSGGNTAGTTGTVNNGILFFGGANITLSESSAAGGATVSIIGGAGAAFSGGVSTGGNTLGTTGTVGNGILFVGGTNITLSQSSAAGGATVSILGASGAAGVIATSVQPVGNVSSIGTITRYAPEDHKHIGVAGMNASGTASTFVGNVMLSGTNLTLVTGGNSSAGSIGFSVAAQTAQTGISGIAGSGASTVTAGTVQFQNSNNITFGLNGSTMTASFSVTNTAPPIATQVYAVSNVGSTGTVTRFAPEDHKHIGVAGINASNTASTFVGNVMFSGTNLTLVTGGNSSAGSLGFSVANPGTLSQWMPPGLGFSTFSQMGQSSLVLFPAALEMNAVFSRADLFASLSISTSSNSSQHGNLSLQVGLYTRNASTLSLATSGSQSYSWDVTGTTSSSSFSGFRGFTVPLAATMTPGEYFIGVLSLTATTNANWITISNLALEPFMSGYAGPFGSATNASNQLVAGLGVFSAQTAALPASVAFGGLLATSAGTVRPVINLLNYTA